MRVLDCSAGLRGMWLDKHFPSAVYVDIRSEVSPDLVASSTCLPFHNETFDLILFDPPHHNVGASGEWSLDYGVFTTAEILNLCRRTFPELRRVVKPAGVVLFKWNDHSIGLSRVMPDPETGLVPLVAQRVAYHTKHASVTTWVTLVRKEGSQ